MENFGSILENLTGYYFNHETQFVFICVVFGFCMTSYFFTTLSYIRLHQAEVMMEIFKKKSKQELVWRRRKVYAHLSLTSFIAVIGVWALIPAEIFDGISKFFTGLIILAGSVAIYYGAYYGFKWLLQYHNKTPKL